MGCTSAQRPSPRPADSATPSATIIPTPADGDFPPLPPIEQVSEPTPSPFPTATPLPPLEISNFSIAPDKGYIRISWATNLPANTSIRAGTSPNPVAGFSFGSKDTWHGSEIKTNEGKNFIVVESCTDFECVRKEVEASPLSFPFKPIPPPREDWYSSLEITGISVVPQEDYAMVNWTTSRPTNDSRVVAYRSDGTANKPGGMEECHGYEEDYWRRPDSMSHSAKIYFCANSTSYRVFIDSCIRGVDCAWAAGPEFTTLEKDPTFYRLDANLSSYLGNKTDRLEHNRQNYWMQEGTLAEYCQNGNARLEGFNFPGNHGHAFIDAQGKVLAGLRDRQGEGLEKYEIGSKETYMQLLKECFQQPTKVQFFVLPVTKPNSEYMGIWFYQPWMSDRALQVLYGKDNYGSSYHAEWSQQTGYTHPQPPSRICWNQAPVCAVAQLGDSFETTTWKQHANACEGQGYRGLFYYGQCLA